MCGIVGFTGAAQAAPILLDGLAKLEYRGYDSAGMAVQNAAGKIEVVKAKGRLKVLSEMTDGGSAVPGSCGIGHTRWATHGEPSVVNAHPHYSRDQKIAVVHNGIIENYQEIKERLLNKGFSFVSQTDTEVVAQLLDYYYMGESAGNALDAITRMMLHVRGSYALGVLFADEPTAELDTNTGLQVVKIFKELCEREGVTIVMTTHDTGLMEIGDCVYELQDGEVISHG